MPTDRLQVYSAALLVCGDRKLMSLTESTDRRKMLDQVWNGGGVDTCLQAGLWNFAGRSQQVDFDPDLGRQFGYQNGFSKSDDWIRTLGVYSDEYMNQPLTQYLDEGGFLFSDLTTIWVRFVSNDQDYGGDLSLWPENFSRYVEQYFAYRICNRLVQSKDDREAIGKDLKILLDQAKSTDAMSEPTATIPLGTWSRARLSRGSRFDRGNRGSLIG